MQTPADSLEAVVRRSYGRILAYLSARSGDIAGAEDALADALRIALERWPASGAPASPEAWLLTTARRRLLDRAKHARVAEAAAPTLLALTEEAAELARSREAFPDERLKLLFVCAHPAIDPAMHTPLMLQTVLGLDAARIASAFLVSPGAMGQRLSRAKLKIKAARIRFAAPDAAELAPRLAAVLAAIYAAYTCGWNDVLATDTRPAGLTAEAVTLLGSPASSPPTNRRRSAWRRWCCIARRAGPRGSVRQATSCRCRNRIRRSGTAC